MNWLLRLLMIVAFVATQGASLEAANCRHGSALAHAAALRSADKRIAAAALGEEDAAAVAAKKGSLSHGGSGWTAVDFVEPQAFAAPVPLVERAVPVPAESVPLAGRTPQPLVPPPLA